MTAEGAFFVESAPDLEVDFAAMERILGAALAGFASDLRLVDALDFAAFIRIGQMANLRSLVHSSAEPYFKPGTIELCELGQALLSWAEPPEILLPMTFRYAGVRVYFRLRLAARSASVELESVAIEDEDSGRLEARLTHAVESAALQPLQTQRTDVAT
ncbi:hypothetical protein JDN40_11790 [Rhodomicrobium vannielii ATCC 17100]|uniref:hypothetical protein n=1 Tax=Rhodomicrobium vannielii TaxID=1069 RepID=UPI00191B29B7|nr:hypothetical protein [Rhodomicrobium vannielii]MBJ7534788.1 hypothetical protein [Rhodomicrobium vannielii ATCC 17100]